MIKSQLIRKVSKKAGCRQMRERLVSERTSRKLTRKQVAEMIGISEIHVRKIEEGSRNPGRENMLKFERFYGVKDRELFPDLFQIDFDTKSIKKITSA